MYDREVEFWKSLEECCEECWRNHGVSKSINEMDIQKEKLAFRGMSSRHLPIYHIKQKYK